MKTNMDKLKEYIDQFGEISSLPSDLQRIEFFDRSFYKFVVQLFKMEHYKYDNPVVRIQKKGDGYMIYTWMASLSYETSLEEYIKKCNENRKSKKDKVITEGRIMSLPIETKC